MTVRYDSPFFNGSDIYFDDPFETQGEGTPVGRFIAIGDAIPDGGGDPVPGQSALAYSHDGITWTGVEGFGGDFNGLTFNPIQQRVVAVASALGTEAQERTMYSDDYGETWTFVAAPGGGGGSWQDVQYGNGKYVAANASGGASEAFMASSDAESWSFEQAPYSFAGQSLAYSPQLDLWVAAGLPSDFSNDVLLVSTGNGTWQAVNDGPTRTQAGFIFRNALAHNNGTFILTTGNNFYRSTDGQNWDAISKPISDLEITQYIPWLDLWISLPFDGDDIAVSDDDGVTWSVVQNAGTFIWPSAIAASPQLNRIVATRFNDDSSGTNPTTQVHVAEDETEFVLEDIGVLGAWNDVLWVEFEDLTATIDGDSATHAHTAQTAGLQESGVLQPDASEHAHTVSSAQILGLFDLQPDDCAHEHTASSAQITDVVTPGLLEPDHCAHGQTASQPFAGPPIDVPWEDARFLDRTRALTWLVEPITAGLHTFYVKAINTSGIESEEAAAIQIFINTPGMPLNFSGQLIAGGREFRLVWDAAQVRSFAIQHYVVGYIEDEVEIIVDAGVDARHYGDLADWEGTRTWFVRAVDIAGNESETNTTNITTESMPLVQNITHRQILGSIHFSWNPPVHDNHGWVEIRRSTTNDIETAETIGTEVSSRFVDSVGEITETTNFYYWFRFVSASGVFGDWHTGDTDGYLVEAEPDPAYLQNILTDLITESQLHPALREGIEAISIPPWDSGEDYDEGDLVHHNGFVYRATDDMPAPSAEPPGGDWVVIGEGTSLGGAFGFAITDHSIRIEQNEDDITANTQSITSLQAGVDDNTAAIEQRLEVNVDGQTATALYAVQAQTTVDGEVVLGGFGLSADGTNVEMGFNVDRFWIGHPGIDYSQEDKVFPFIIDDGQVFIDDAFIRELGADKLTAGTIDAAEIDVINLNASNITAGTIDASQINVTNINASNIVSGTIDAIDITGVNITGSTITGSTLQTSASGERFVVDSSDNRARFFDSSNNQIVVIGPSQPTGFGENFTGRFIGDHHGLLAETEAGPFAALWAENHASSGVGRAIVARGRTSIISEGSVTGALLHSTSIYPENGPLFLRHNITAGSSVTTRVKVPGAGRLQISTSADADHQEVLRAGPLGAIGTVAFLIASDLQGTGPGSTKSGSNLNWAGARSDGGTTSNSSPSISGTWRCLGHAPADDTKGDEFATATLWVRIS